MEQTTILTIHQKIIMGVLYSSIILLIVFSILATKNLGQDGYERCVEQKCQERGEKFCTKVRELNNCCQGAGGTLSINQLSDDLKHTACRFD